MHDFTPWPALAGGILIGLAASLFLFLHGRIAGISGLWGDLVGSGVDDRRTPLAFVLGLAAIGIVAGAVAPELVRAPAGSLRLPIVAIAGVLVGFGTRLGSGCTSGHGVCGIGRFSPRSLLATGVFMATGFGTVFVVRHLLGGGP